VDVPWALAGGDKESALKENNAAKIRRHRGGPSGLFLVMFAVMFLVISLVIFLGMVISI
jgi:hypothetical protein